MRIMILLTNFQANCEWIRPPLRRHASFRGRCKYVGRIKARSAFDGRNEHDAEEKIDGLARVFGEAVDLAVKGPCFC